MKQRKLLKEVYRACIDHDQERIEELRKKEFEKIIKHKHRGTKFDAKWTAVRI